MNFVSVFSLGALVDGEETSQWEDKRVNEVSLLEAVLASMLLFTRYHLRCGGLC